MKRSAWSFGVCLPAAGSEHKERPVRLGSQAGVTFCYPGKAARALSAAGRPGRAMRNRRPGRGSPRSGPWSGAGRGGGWLPAPAPRPALTFAEVMGVFY